MNGIIYKSLYDEDGAIYSVDGKKLFKVPDIPFYRIHEGVEIIDNLAFKDCMCLKEIDVPYTVEWFTDDPSSNEALRFAPKGLKVNYWNWPYPENCIRSEMLESEIANGIIDEYGAVYSKDGKKLLKCADIKCYKVREGVETIDKLAFVGCNNLECLYIPYTCPEESFDAILGGSDTVGAISFLDRPYVPEELDPNGIWADDKVFIDEYGVVYSIDRKRLLYARACFNRDEYTVPEGTFTICDQAFLFHEGYLILSVPSSIKVIGDDIFGKDGGKILLR